MLLLLLHKPLLLLLLLLLLLYLRVLVHNVWLRLGLRLRLRLRLELLLLLLLGQHEVAVVPNLALNRWPRRHSVHCLPLREGLARRIIAILATALCNALIGR